MLKLFLVCLFPNNHLLILFRENGLLFIAAVLAQSVERMTAEREVAGSFPGAGPILRVLK